MCRNSYVQLHEKHCEKSFCFLIFSWACQNKEIYYCTEFFFFFKLIKLFHTSRKVHTKREKEQLIYSHWN